LRAATGQGECWERGLGKGGGGEGPLRGRLCAFSGGCGVFYFAGVLRAGVLDDSGVVGCKICSPSIVLGSMVVLLVGFLRGALVLYSMCTLGPASKRVYPRTPHLSI